MSAAAVADRRSAVRGVAWGGVETTASAVVGLCLTPLVVRFAGIEGLGLWGASWSLAHSAGTFDLGVGASYARFTARAIALGDAAALNRTVSAGVGLYIVLIALLGAGAFRAGPALLSRLETGAVPGGVATIVLGCALLTVACRALLSAYRGVLAGAQRIDLMSRIGTAAVVVEGIAAAAILLSGRGLAGMAVNSLCVALLWSLAEAIAAHREVPALRVRPFRAGRGDYAEIVGFGLRLQATRAAEILGEHVPRLALAWGPGLTAAGLYDLGARLAGVQRIAGRLPLPVLQPLASRLEALGRRDRLEEVLRHSTRYVAVLVFPACALLLLHAETLLCAWTGRPQDAAASAVRFLSAALCITLVLSPLRLVLRGCGFPGVEAISAGGGALLHLALAVSLAPLFGVRGVAGAAPIAALAAAVLLATGARRAGAPVGLAALWRAIGGAAAAGLAVLGSGWLLHVFRHPVAAASRSEALLQLIPDAALALGAGALVAVIAGAIRREDLLLLRDLRQAGGETA